MSDQESKLDSHHLGLTVSPSLDSVLSAAHVHTHQPLIDRRVCFISLIAVGLAVAATLVAQILTQLIGFITNLSFYGRFSTAFTSPANNTLGVQATEPKSSLFDGTAPPVYHFRRFDLYHFMT
jgi:hypothetical protein